ncbi:hypothetical protein G9A89_010945 [Geosiphon pyriformis]|nr:hypothetical protein G9A89_010945 [Geosiphon pyriformis]
MNLGKKFNENVSIQNQLNFIPGYENHYEGSPYCDHNCSSYNQHHSISLPKLNSSTNLCGVSQSGLFDFESLRLPSPKRDDSGHSNIFWGDTKTSQILPNSPDSPKSSASSPLTPENSFLRFGTSSRNLEFNRLDSVAFAPTWKPKKSY